MKKTRQLFRAGTALLALLLLFSVAPLPAAAADELSPYTLEDFHPAALGNRAYDDIGEFVDGVAFYQVDADEYGENGKCGLIGTDGKEITAPIFETEHFGLSHFSNGLARVVKDYQSGYINTKGQLVLPYQYESAMDFSEGLASVCFENGKYGYINTSGKTAIQPIYEKANTFSNGLAAVYRPDSSGRVKAGYVNPAGKEIIPVQYNKTNDFINGYAVVENDPEGNGRFEYNAIIDKTGKQVVPMAKRSYNDVYKLYSELGGSPRGYEEYCDDGYFRCYYPDCTIRATIIHSTDKFAPAELKDFELFDKNGTLLTATPCNFLRPFSCGFAVADGGLIDKQGGTVAGVGGIIEGFDAGGHTIQWKGGRRAYILTSPLAPVKVAPAASKVLVDGKQVAFDAYAIHGNNYFKLRDIAQILNGTGKQFNVTWNKEKSAIDMQSGTAYLPVGGELTPGGGAKTARRSSAPIYLNGAPVSLAIYDIGGNNYFKLRDLGQTFDFQVAWDSAAKAVVIDTALHYTAPVA